MKSALTKAPVLAYPDPVAGGEFILDTDASDLGIGAVLSQRQAGEERVIAYFSRVLSRPERRYCVTRKELLAAVKAIRHFYPYLYGKKFLLRTDHSALRWLLSFRHPEGQIARWIESLQQFEFSVEHRPGSKHGNADALSRRPCLRDSCRPCDRMDSLEHAERTKDAVPRGDQVQSTSPLPLPEQPTGEETHHLSLSAGQGEQSLSKAILGEPVVASTSLDTLCFDLAETSGPREMRLSQVSDVDIKPVVEWLEKGSVRPSWEEIAPHSEATKAYWAQWKSLELCDGVLYRRWETPSGDSTTKQLIVPKDLRPALLHQLHGVPTAGHFGVAKTLGRLRERFYWVWCHRDVQDWCRNCDLCAQKRGPQRKTKARLGQYNVGSPMERLAVDVMGPLPLTEAGNKYILVIADYFSKWVEAYPLPNQEAKTVAEVLVKECVCRFGAPLYLHSDQGRNFEASVFAEVCLLLGIKKTRTTPYHPQSDGMVERFNRTLAAQLSKFVDYHQKDWDTHIPFLLMAYRSAVHDTTGCTPAKVMFGRDLRLPVDLQFGRPTEEPRPVTEYVATMQEKIERVHHFARTHLKLMSDQMKERYNCALEGQPLEAGEAAWLHNPQRKKGLSPKLSRPWQGPYTVTKQINDLVYRIQLGPTTKPRVVHRNRLWRYRGSSPPTWFQETEGRQTAPSPRPAELVGEPETLDGSEPEVSQPQLRRSRRTRRPPEHYGVVQTESS